MLSCDRCNNGDILAGYCVVTMVPEATVIERPCQHLQLALRWQGPLPRWTACAKHDAASDSPSDTIMTLTRQIVSCLDEIQPY